MFDSTEKLYTKTNNYNFRKDSPDNYYDVEVVNDNLDKIDNIIKDVETKNTNVQSDWNITNTTSSAFIKNKPTSLQANGGTADTIKNTLPINKGGTGATDILNALKNLNLLNNTFNNKPSCSALVYKDFSDFGLESMTMFRFASLMPDCSSIIFHTYKNAATYITDAPTDEGVIFFIRSSINSRVALFFSTAGNSRGVNYQWSANSAVLLQNWTKVNDGGDADTVDGKHASDLQNYNNLTNKPTSLPANGGNADTVDGKHATDLQNYNNLTNKPTSLPANGGNADTVDGKHANEFATSTQVTTINNTLNNKVDKVAGKDLSTNDFTAAYKTKLDGISAGAEQNVQSDWNVTDANSNAFIKNKPTSIPANGGNADTVDGKHATDLQNYNNLTNKPTSLPANGGNADTVDGKHANEFATAPQVTTINNTLNNKVDKVSGKDLSTNDFTAAYKTKLDGISAGAEQNVQSDWNVTDANSNAFIKNKPQDLVNKTKLPTMCPQGFYKEYLNLILESNTYYRIAIDRIARGNGIFTLGVVSDKIMVFESQVVFALSSGFNSIDLDNATRLNILSYGFLRPSINKILIGTNIRHGNYIFQLLIKTTDFKGASPVDARIYMNFIGREYESLENVEKVNILDYEIVTEAELK